MNFNLISASRLLKELYLDLVKNIIQGNEPPSAEELAETVLNQFENFKNF